MTVIIFNRFAMSIASPTELSLRCCMRVKPQMSFNSDVVINFASKKFRDDMMKQRLKLAQDVRNTAYDDKLRCAESIGMDPRVIDDR